MTTLFITHDLSTVYYLGGEVMVITKGSIVERGPVSEVMHEPSHPYTKLLLDSIPQPDPDKRWSTRIAVDELEHLDDNTPGDTTAPEAPVI